MISLPAATAIKTVAQTFDAFRGGLRLGSDTRPMWHLVVLAGCILFFFDVLFRRLTAWRRVIPESFQRLAPTPAAEFAGSSRPPRSARGAVANRPAPTHAAAPDAMETDAEPSYMSRLKQAKQSSQKQWKR